MKTDATGRYIHQREAQIKQEQAKPSPNLHLIAVLQMHIHMAKDAKFTSKYGLVTDDSHGEFARAYLLNQY